ncbi:MAG: rhamnulokinase family protein [Pirellulaceae bacterium]|nr:rhamnulokinase family protein [Pirellulaceae bacterium]
MAGKEKVYLAVDIGASSGRVVAGLFDGRRLALQEVHRFTNGGFLANDRLYWDALALWGHLQDGLRKAAVTYPGRVASVGVDTWGVDYGLLGPGDELLGNPRHYRDRRTHGQLEKALQVVSREEIFAETGLQFMELNTLYQLLAMRQENPSLLDLAESFLMIPDLFHWLLTGNKANEFTNASTTQFCNATTQTWSTELLQRFDIPTRMLGGIVHPGTDLGTLRAAVAEATGLSDVRVILPGTHDTASAVMAVPATSQPGTSADWCYISSGTWSLMGAETQAPVINDRCRELNFTNEGGIGGTTRLLKNIAGLWLLQECQRAWERQGVSRTWEEIVQLAGSAKPLASLVAPDRTEFVAPQDMPTALRRACADTGEPVPDSDAAVARCALESLAVRYRMVLGWTEQLVGSPINTVHVVGGGTRNQLLCQMTADACQRIVLAGPVEATAIGNLMMQVLADNEVASVSEARKVIRASFPVDEYTPGDSAPWDDAFERLERLV